MVRKKVVARLFKAMVLLVLVGSGAHAHSYCYSLYNPRQMLVSRTSQPPVDVSKQYGEALASRYPGHHLVVTDADHCAVQMVQASTAPAPRTVGGFPEGSWVAQIRDVSDLKNADVGGLHDSYGGSVRGGQRGTPGTAVRVRSYTRDDGTQVRSHTRSAPGTVRGR